MMDACCKPSHRQYPVTGYRYEELGASLHDACSTSNNVGPIYDRAFLVREKRSLFLPRADLHPSTAYCYASTLNKIESRAPESRNLNRVPFRNFGLPSYLGPTNPRVIANRVEPFSTTAFQAPPEATTMMSQ